MSQSVLLMDDIQCVFTSSPGLSGGLFTSLLADSVRLPLVLGHASVNRPINNTSYQLLFLHWHASLRNSLFLALDEDGIGILDDIGADRRGEDGRERVGRASGFPLHRVDRDSRTRRHFVAGSREALCGLRRWSLEMSRSNRKSSRE